MLLPFLNCAQAIELSDTVADAISAHPNVKEKVHVYRQVVSDQSIASSTNRPSIDLQASTGLYNTESPATGNSAVDYDSTRLELSLTQNLFNGYQSTNQIKQTESRSRAALFDLYDTADNIALETIQAYLDVLKQQRLHQLATENVNSHEAILAQIRERNNSGVGRRSQLQQTEGRVARAHASLIAQQNNFQDASTQLHQVLGRYVDVTELSEPVLPESPQDDLNNLIDLALLHHPAVKVASNNIEAARFEHKSSTSTKYPNLDLRVASEWGNDIGGVTGDTTELSVVLNLSYNFYNGGADKAEQQKKISEVYEQKEFAARVRRQIINTLRLSWVADESLTRQLEFLQRHVEKAKETVGSYKEEFFIGQRDLVDLLDAENELNTARNEHTNAYYDLLTARYRVYEAFGGLFDALSLQSQIDDNDFTIARVQANDKDELPLPEDEDKDEEKDKTDHCDNSILQSTVNTYGCEQMGKVNMGYVQTNSTPVVGNDELEVDSHGMLIISRQQLLANDTDADNDVLEIVDVGKPANGRLAFDKNKNLIYRPAEGQYGADTFTYTVADGNGATATAAVKLLVIKTNKIDLSKMQLVNFKYKETVLTDISQTKVESIIEKIKMENDVSIQILTHTDSIGSARYNQGLSDRRAQAMKELLISRGINAEDISVLGMGEASPIADNATKAGQAINRRGEFIFTEKDVVQ